MPQNPCSTQARTALHSLFVVLRLREQAGIYWVSFQLVLRTSVAFFTLCIMLAFSTFLVLQSLLTTRIQAAPLLSSLFPSFATRGDPLCNGYAALCDRKYSDITFIGTHDSPFIGDLLTQDQTESLTDQLNGGIRFLQSQTHDFADSLQMCHTSCVLEDGGSVEDYLNTVKTWMNSNPSDVITLLLTNPERISLSKFDAVFKTTGLDKFAFIPATSPAPLAMDSWPTLGDLITAGQRLVVFMGE